MFQSNHSWDHMWPKDPKGVIDNKHILDSIIDKNETVLKSSGSPMTIWKHYPFGPYCTCAIGEDKKQIKPDSNCRICMGTGYINGYQKYGYYTYTYAADSINSDDRFGLNLSNINIIDIPKQNSKAFVLEKGTSGYLETNWIPTKNGYEHSYLKSMIFTPQGTSVTYSCTFNGSDYILINHLDNIKDLEVKEAIKIKLTLSRNSTNIPSPAVNAFKYRIRMKDIYYNYDRRFSILTPAFLASKQIIDRRYMMTQDGTTVQYKPVFWALPDVKIGEKDIGMFLVGNHENQRFEFENLTISEHGENQRVLHTKWNSRFIFSNDDVLGNIYKLD